MVKKIIIEKKGISIAPVGAFIGISMKPIYNLTNTIVGNDNTIYFQILFWFIYFSFSILLYCIYYSIINTISKTKKYSIFTKKDISIFSIFFILFTCCLIIYKLIKHKEPDFTISFAILIANSIVYFIFYSMLKKYNKI